MINIITTKTKSKKHKKLKFSKLYIKKRLRLNHKILHNKINVKIDTETALIESTQSSNTDSDNLINIFENTM
jgi:hypothetical protein